MATSRIQKYKDYRNSLIKEDVPELESPIVNDKTEHSTFETTSTLPYDQVMKELSKEENAALVEKKQKNTLVLQILIFVGIVVLVIAAIIIFAFIVF